MMGIVVPETCSADKKYNKIMWHLVGFLFFSYHNDARSNEHQIYLNLIVSIQIYTYGYLAEPVN